MELAIRQFASIAGCAADMTCVNLTGSSGVERGGPLIEWHGEKHELCPWSKLIAVEDCREEVVAADGLAGLDVGLRNAAVAAVL